MFKMFKSDRKIEIKQHIPFLIYFVLITIFSIAFDQISKIIAENNLQVGVAIPFIPGFIDFLLTYNLGAAWGMGDGEVWSRVLLCITSWVVALFIPCYLVYRFKKKQKITPLLGVSIALIFGGDIGNLIDRTFFFNRGVIDFISIQSWFPGFGIFNIADSCLVVGIFILFLYYILEEFKNAKAERERNIQLLKEKENSSEVVSSEKNKDE